MTASIGICERLSLPCEVVAQTRKFIRRGSPSALARLAGQAQLRARLACLLDDLRPHGKPLTFLAALRTTPSHTRSFATVAGPVPLARLERT